MKKKKRAGCQIYKRYLLQIPILEMFNQVSRFSFNIHIFDVTFAEAQQ